MTKHDEVRALYVAQTICLSKMAGDHGENDRLDRVLFRIDERMYELSPRTNRTPWARRKTQLNEMVYGKESN